MKPGERCRLRRNLLPRWRQEGFLVYRRIANVLIVNGKYLKIKFDNSNQTLTVHEDDVEQIEEPKP